MHMQRLLFAAATALSPGLAHAQSTSADESHRAPSPPAATTAEPSPGANNDSASPGFLLAARLGALVVLENSGTVGQLKPGLALSATAGFFPIAQLGIFVGYRGSVLHLFHSDTVCGGRTSQIPVVLEYAPEGRTRGLFVDGGVGLLNSVRIDPCFSVDAAETFSNPVTGKLAVGYRRGVSNTSGWGLEVRLGVDVGSFSSYELEGRTGLSDSNSLHYLYNVVDLTMGIYYAP